MIRKGAVTPVRTHSKEGFLSSIFLVPKKDGHRPIINLKKLNRFIPHNHFKMEGVHMLKDLLRKGDWMAKVDQKDTYLTGKTGNTGVQVGERDISIQLPTFGLSCAPWVFTKITRAAASVLREMGIRLIVYIDDILMAESETESRGHTAGVIYLLENLG